MKIFKTLFMLIAVVLVLASLSYASVYTMTGTTNTVTVNASACFIKGVSITNETGAGVTLTLKDNTTQKYVVYCAANSMVDVNLAIELSENIACDTSLKVVCSTQSASVSVAIANQKR